MEAQMKSLKAQLEEYKVPESLVANLSDAWQCKLAPSVSEHDAQLKMVCDGVPIFTDVSYNSQLFEAVGTDALKFITDDRWNQFQRPKMAFLGGWGRPGQSMIDADKFTLTNSFSEIIEDTSRALNLQMFHRESAEIDSSKELPVLPGLLQWPLPEFFDENHSEVVDMATRVSCADAITWWHLDDCGEFVYQTALPLDESKMTRPVCLGPHGKPIVKLFIVFPKESYDVIVQDDVSNKTGRISALDLFDTTTDQLPEKLPVVTIAPLEAGGPPFLLAPNVPHLVVTLQTCVMTEQRRISNMCLDEVQYFLHRALTWADPPILYDYVQETLFDEKYVKETIVGRLTKIVTDSGEPLLAARALHSLYAFLSFPEQYNEPVGWVANDIKELVRSTPLVPDKRSENQRAIMAAFNKRTKGVHCLVDGSYAAYIHEFGRPRWGPSRPTLAMAKKDRKLLTAAKKEKRLTEVLVSLRAEK